jgi:alkylhydroperoxidase/carboxymuconolactone decarboxylase family protein YurZ
MSFLSTSRKVWRTNSHTKEIIDVITHPAFYAGWPPTMMAPRLARQAFEEVDGTAGN